MLLPMKTLVFSLLALLSLQAYAQDNIIYITPQQLAENIKNSTKATVLQYWVPNCANAAEIVTHFGEMQNNHSQDVDFYFVGITNKKELITALLEKTGYSHKIYIADPSVNDDLQSRKETFSKKLCQLLTLKKKDFITMYINKKDKVIYYNDAIDIEEDKLKEMI